MGLPVTLSGLPVVGALSYGGVQFEELLKSKVVGHTVWDKARRVVKYVKYVLEVDGFVISRDRRPNDPTWAELRYILQKPGLPLTYSDRGFSNFNVNTDLTNGLVDVCDGPRPELLDFTPMGARLAARIVWKCEICVPEIANVGHGVRLYQTPFSRGIIAFNWTTELNFPDDGYAKYTVGGELEIARVRGKPDNLESYRAYTEPQMPSGFRPTGRTFKTDEAKRTIVFGYSFEEMAPMGIPTRCTKAGGSYQVYCNQGPALVNWTAKLSATYTTLPTGPRREAYVRFMGLMRDRLNYVSAATAPTVETSSSSTFWQWLNTPIFGGEPRPPTVFGFAIGSPIAAPADTSHVVIRTFSLNEGLYEDSKQSSFECSWTFVAQFAQIFLASGAWRKMDDCAGITNAAGRDVWAADMASVMGYTSWYAYGFRPDAEVVVSTDTHSLGPFPTDNKEGNTGNTIDDTTRVTAGAGLVRDGVDPDTGAVPDSEVRIPGLPPPESSWLNYQIDFVTDLDPGIALHKPLPQRADPVDTLGSVDVFSAKPDAYKDKGVNTESRSSGQDILQRMATSTYRVALRGYGVRLGYKVPVPDLKVFGGVEVSPAKQRVIGPRVVANYSGIPVYLTAWVLWYDVPTPPRRQQAAPPNLAQHIGEVENPPGALAVPISIPELPPRVGKALPTLSPPVDPRTRLPEGRFQQ